MAVESLGLRAENATFDVTNEDQIAGFFSGHTHIDHLVTAAAGTARGLVTELEVAKVQELLESK